jgi:hypothetical protein
MRALHVGALALLTRHAPVRMADDVSKWFIEPPGTFEAMATQATRSVLSAVPDRRRLVVEASVPELDPLSPSFQPQELVGFAAEVAEPLISRAGLPRSRPHVKLLFGSPADAALAGASIQITDLPVSVLGHPSALGPRDGAFVVVAPTASSDAVDAERALSDLLEAAGQRVVVLVNPRLGNAPLLQTFEACYMMRPLTVGFLRDQRAQQVERVPVRLLRCYPHEWAVLHGPPGDGNQPATQWRYAGRFTRQPKPEQIERLLGEQLTRARDEMARASESEEI